MSGDTLERKKKVRSKEEMSRTGQNRGENEKD
jgi:hypothetical protein